MSSVIKNTSICRGVRLNMSRKVKKIFRAAESGNTEEVQKLLDEGVDVDIRNDNRSTLLHLAARNGHAKTVELLLNKGAKVNAKDNDGNTPRLLAAMQARKEVEELLGRRGGIE